MASFAQQVTCCLLLALVIANGVDGAYHYCREQFRDHAATLGVEWARLAGVHTQLSRSAAFKHSHFLRAA
jgi:hypothetical protein